MTHGEAQEDPAVPPGGPDRRGLPNGPEGPGDVRAHAPRDAGDDSAHHLEPVDQQGDRPVHGSDEPSQLEPLPRDLQAIVPVLIQQLQAHMHLPVTLPDPETLAALKKSDPKAHKMMLKLIKQRADHDRWMERAPIEQPARIAKNGQAAGLLAVLAAFGLSAYVAHLNHPVSAAVIAAVDVVTLAAIFVRGDKPS